MAFLRSLPFLVFFLLVGAGCTNDGNVTPPTPPGPGNLPPVIVIDGPAKVAKDSTIRFDASNSTDPEGDPIEFFWEESEDNPSNNFFDGVAANEPRIQLLVDVVGTFTYILTATDSEGNVSSSPVTVTVTEIPGEAPVITGVKINGVLFDFATTPSPTAFTTPSKTLNIQVIGTDVDSAPSKLTATFSAPIVNGVYTAPDMADDADGFRTVSAQISLMDAEEHTSDTKTIYFRIVPKAMKDLQPRALFVNCGAATNGSGTSTNPYNSIQSAYDAASLVTLAIRPDVYVASGTCAEAIHVDFNNVNLYGLFQPSNGWTRRTDTGTAMASRFAAPTILTKPNVESLLYTTTVNGQNGLLIDGFSFQLNGNYYGIDLTSPATENEKLTIQNSEFTGETIASANFKVGGGIRIKQGTSIDNDPQFEGAIIRRNLFMVDAADGGSRFQVWATHKDDPAKASRKKQFYSNVFYGGIGFTTTYSCGEESQKPFAFCLYKTKGDSNSSFDHWSHAARNLFWITEGVSTTVPATLLSAGGGHMKANGNIFRSTAPATHAIRYLHGYLSSPSVGSEYIGDFSFNAFPVYAANVTLVVDNNVTPNSYNCLDLSGADDLLGKYGGASCGSPLPIPGVIGYADGSFHYTTVTVGSPYLWRLSSTQFSDVVLNAIIPAAAMWDFDGRYGAGNDAASTGTTEYNAGPFEPAASNP